MFFVKVATYSELFSTTTSDVPRTQWLRVNIMARSTDISGNHDPPCRSLTHCSCRLEIARLSWRCGGRFQDCHQLRLAAQNCRESRAIRNTNSVMKYPAYETISDPASELTVGQLTVIRPLLPGVQVEYRKAIRREGGSVETELIGILTKSAIHAFRNLSALSTITLIEIPNQKTGSGRSYQVSPNPTP